MQTPTRCAWARTKPLMIDYHDREWGVPLRDDRKLFELLLLEGAQAGLSWDTILTKREGYRRAFDGFDPATMARYDAPTVARLLADPGIVRNRLKIAAAIGNAQAYLDLQAQGIRFADFLWRFVDGRAMINRWRRPDQVPVSTAISDAMSKELKRCGFRFVGSTILYAFMQASGMVNDHLVGCFRHAEVGASSKASAVRRRPPVRGVGE